MLDFVRNMDVQNINPLKRSPFPPDNLCLWKLLSTNVQTPESLLKNILLKDILHTYVDNTYMKSSFQCHLGLFLDNSGEELLYSI